MKLTIISLALLLTSYNAIQKNVGSSLQKTEIEYQIEDILIETRDGVKVSGIGKIVTKENIKDANELLIAKWYNSSFVEIPIWEE